MTERCRRCKRMIKNTTSVTHGYGPSCWKKVLKEAIPIVCDPEIKEKVYMSVDNSNM